MGDYFGDLRIVSFWMGTVVGRAACSYMFKAHLSRRAEKGNIRTSRFPEGGHISSLEIKINRKRMPDRRTVWHFEANGSQGYDSECDPVGLAILASRIARFCEESFFFATSA